MQKKFEKNDVECRSQGEEIFADSEIDCPVCSRKYLANLGFESTVKGLTSAGFFDSFSPRRVCLACKKCIAIENAVFEEKMHEDFKKAFLKNTTILECPARIPVQAQ